MINQEAPRGGLSGCENENYSLKAEMLIHETPSVNNVSHYTNTHPAELSQNKNQLKINTGPGSSKPNKNHITVQQSSWV